MSLWVPPKVARALIEERLRFAADVDRQVTGGGFDNEMRRRFERELQQIDPRLRLVKARPQATDPTLRPGYWHILRDNPGAPPSVIPVEGPAGEYREPSAEMFETLARGDLWNESNMQMLRGARRRAEAAAERERERARERRLAEFSERVDAATRTQVSMNRDTPWTQNASAASRRDAATRRRKAA